MQYLNIKTTLSIQPYVDNEALLKTHCRIVNHHSLVSPFEDNYDLHMIIHKYQDQLQNRGILIKQAIKIQSTK